MAKEDNQSKNLEEASDAELKSELEKRIEKKFEAWGDSLEKKADSFEGKLPRPVNAIFDALCVSVVIAAALWAFKKFNWINNMPPWTTFVIIFLSLLVISLIYRFSIKKGKPCK